MALLSQLLVDIKVARVRQRKSKRLGGPAYDAMADAVCRLYTWLDCTNIEQIERLCNTKLNRPLKS